MPTLYSKKIRYNMYSLITAVLLFIAYGTYERVKHNRNRRKIKKIIHVNGTRGKSSVTRLIAAGLRAGGFKVMAKTTGSAPKIIFETGKEIPVVRYFGANIKEQMKIVRFASKRDLDFLVLECMAVNPEYQWVTEHQMVQSDIGVITNTRLDHLDLMGPGIRNCTLSLSNTIPFDRVVYTGEQEMFPLLEKVAKERNSDIHMSDGATISNEVISNFSHIEHKDNVALALKVCNDLGVDTDDALEGMYKAEPDVGASFVYTLNQDGKEIKFANFFAANDPESTSYSIKYISNIHSDADQVYIVLSTREDRMYRSEQLAEMVVNEKFDKIILVGDEPRKVRDYLKKYGVKSDKILLYGMVEGEKFTQRVYENPFKKALLIGIGNIHGNGSILLNYFGNSEVD
jgi:poly-gamma-glutamate synthase PgsB/CapB